MMVGDDPERREEKCAVVAKTRDENERGHDSTPVSLALESDALAILQRRAEETGKSIGAIASDLIRVAQHWEDESAEEEALPPFVIPRRKGAPMVTMALVNRLRDEGE